MNLDVLYHPVMEALGAALMHSLWQGALVAVGLYIALRIVNNRDSGTRYALCCAALALLFLLPVSTGIQVYLTNQVKPALPVQAQYPAQHIDPQLMAPLSEIEPVTVPMGVEDAFSDANSAPFAWRPFLVALWFIGVTVLSLQWTNSLLRVHRLKRSGLVIESEAIQASFDALLDRMGVAKKVHLLTSAYVDQPMVMGWVKPVVLLPLSVATNLPPEHVEAILAHELAHVRRHDYLVLVLQSVMEVLFFYHPAVWWVSRQMRIEREFCCDDLATKVLGNDLVYVTALANLDHRRAGKLALGANDGRLVDRIRRIVKGKGRSSNQRTSWLGVGLLLVGCGLLVSACMDWRKADLDGTPEELYESAMEKVNEHNYTAALPYAEKAAEQGHMCSMHVLSEMYDEHKRAFTEMDGTRFIPVQWGYRDEDASMHWAKAYMEELRKKADAGDNIAMLWLSLAYKDNFQWGPFSDVLEESDSLASHWMQRAAEAGNPYALRRKAIKLVEEQDYESAGKLFEKAAELGDQAAYFWWSHNNSYDPVKYFEILDLGVQNQAKGIHEIIRQRVAELDKQIALGNEVSVQWKEIADSYQFEERLEAFEEVPVTIPWPEFQTRPCGWNRNWYYYDGGKKEGWLNKTSD
ncbi:MAG: SEL1-like repeat protein [Rhodothermaceae bacterium]|nr:SEL1-like repeat protein [Rhodothermaceae bacterium]